MVRKCCFCLDVRTGAYLIGCVHLLSLIYGVYALDLLHVALEAFCGVTFLLMVAKDSEQARLFYFAAYAVQVVILTAMRVYFLVWGESQAEVPKLCEGYLKMEMKATGASPETSSSSGAVAQEETQKSEFKNM